MTIKRQKLKIIQIRLNSPSGDWSINLSCIPIMKYKIIIKKNNYWLPNNIDKAYTLRWAKEDSIK